MSDGNLTPEAGKGVRPITSLSSLSDVAPILAPGGRVIVASVPPVPGGAVWDFMDGKPPEYFFGGDAP